MTGGEQFEAARRDALELAYDAPVDAICKIVHALHWKLGRDCDEIALDLEKLQACEGVDGLRSWIKGLA